MFVPYSLFNTLTGLEIENEDIILLPRNNGENFTLNIQNSPLKEKFYNLSFQQRSQVHVQIKTFFSLNSQDRTRLIVVGWLAHKVLETAQIGQIPLSLF